MTRYELNCMVGRHGLLEAADVWLHVLRLPSSRICNRIDRELLLAAAMNGFAAPGAATAHHHQP